MKKLLSISLLLSMGLQAGRGLEVEGGAEIYESEQQIQEAREADLNVQREEQELAARQAVRENHGYGSFVSRPEVTELQRVTSKVPTAKTAQLDAKLPADDFWKGNVDYDRNTNSVEDYSITDWGDRQFSEEELAKDEARLAARAQEKARQAQEMNIRREALKIEKAYPSMRDYRHLIYDFAKIMNTGIPKGESVVIGQHTFTSEEVQKLRSEVAESEYNASNYGTDVISIDQIFGQYYGTGK